MPYCDMADITRCNGYRGDYDTYFCGKECMRMNDEAPRGRVSVIDPESDDIEPRERDT